MKKMKKLSLILLILTTIMMTGFNVYEYLTSDTEPPVINCPEKPLKASVDVTEEELLKGVTAADRKSGNVTESVVVEKLSHMLKDGTRIITYAAIDQEGNVGRRERKLIYTDYEKPKLKLTAPLRYPMEHKPANWIENVHARSVLDGDLTDSVKYQLLDNHLWQDKESGEIEIKVSDSAGGMENVTLEAQLYSEKEETIDVSLKKYLIYVKTGASFDPEDYYKGSDQPGDLTIDSSVNTGKPGIYYVDYTVKDSYSMGKSRLTVIVRDDRKER